MKAFNRTGKIEKPFFEHSFYDRARCIFGTFRAGTEREVIVVKTYGNRLHTRTVDARTREELTLKVSRDLKAKINRLAHNAGLAHAGQVKARLSAVVERLIAAGDSLATITAHLDNPGQSQCTGACAGMHDLLTTAEAFGDLPTTAEAFGDLPVFDDLPT